MAVVFRFLLSLPFTLSLALTTPVLAQSATAGTPAQHLQRAQSLLAQKKPQEAIPEFRAVLAADPGNLDAAGNLGVLLYFAADYKDSEPLLRQIVAAQPVAHPIPKLQALLGLCERHNGNLIAALKDLTAALPGLQEPAIRREAGLELIELETAAGDLPSAAATVAQLKRTAPEDPGILYASYRINTDLAAEAMLDLSIAAPNSAQMHQAMAHELLNKRENKAAIANLRAAIAADPDLPGIHYELAEALRRSPEPPLKAEAEQQFQLALKSNPNDPKTITKLAEIAADRAEHEKAISLYRKALELSPNESDAGIGLAHELVETNQLAPALAILQALEQADPTDVLTHFRLSALYRRMGKPDDAKREFAEYNKYKAIKDKLHALYKEMRLDAPGTTTAEQ